MTRRSTRRRPITSCPTSTTGRTLVGTAMTTWTRPFTDPPSLSHPPRDPRIPCHPPRTPASPVTLSQISGSPVTSPPGTLGSPSPPRPGHQGSLSPASPGRLGPLSPSPPASRWHLCSRDGGDTPDWGGDMGRPAVPNLGGSRGVPKPRGG